MPAAPLADNLSGLRVVFQGEEAAFEGSANNYPSSFQYQTNLNAS